MVLIHSAMLNMHWKIWRYVVKYTIQDLNILVNMEVLLGSLFLVYIIMDEIRAFPVVWGEHDSHDVLNSTLKNTQYKKGHSLFELIFSNIPGESSYCGQILIFRQ